MGNIQKIKTANLIKNGESIAINLENGDVIFLNTNLIKNVLSIPYTKKDGSKVTAKDFVKQANERQLRREEKKAQ